MKQHAVTMSLMLITCAALGALRAEAHFPMWMADNPMPNQGESVRLFFGVGHPFEQYFEDAHKPERVTAITPTGRRIDLSDQLTEAQKEFTDDGEPQSARIWEVDYTPEVSGDVIVAMDSPLLTFDSVNEAWHEFGKLILHVERQRGWQTRTGQALEFVPLTRPYGLEEGFVFRGRLMNGNQPVAGETVYLERYNPTVPDPLPDETKITWEVVTDSHGIFTVTLPSDGWWLMAAEVRELDEIEHEGETYSYNATAVMTLHVDPKTE